MVRPFRVTIVGAGRVGSALAHLLRDDPAYVVRLIDGVPEVVDRVAARGFDIRQLGVECEDDALAALSGADAVVAAVPERIVRLVAGLARRLGIHHLDFSGVRATGVSASPPGAPGPAVLPASGVSPGLVDDIVAEVVDRYDFIDELVVRVGAIPSKPVGRLGYADIWDIDGLVAEYTRPADVIIAGRKRSVPALSGHEILQWNGATFEAFVTADGSHALVDLCRGKVADATVKTIRHPGHLDHMLFLLDELGLRRRLDFLRNLLRNALPCAEDDMVLIHVTVRGRVGGEAREETISHVIRSLPSRSGAPATSALARGAAANAADLLDALAAGRPIAPFSVRRSSGRLKSVLT